MKPIGRDLTGIHVLLVDDNEDSLAIFGMSLRHAGATVSTAQSGAEALAQLAQARAHVIVTDLSMPGMDGVELVVRLRDQRQNTSDNPPVIAVTAFPKAYTFERMRDAGFRSYLVKPVTPERLVQEVRSAFDHAYGPERT